jgi:hypothetical protein
MKVAQVLALDLKKNQTLLVPVPAPAQVPAVVQDQALMMNQALVLEVALILMNLEVDLAATMKVVRMMTMKKKIKKSISNLPLSKKYLIV